MKATKTFKIGEYATGGVITANVNGNDLTIIAKDWDFSAGSNKGSNQSKAKEFDRETVNCKTDGAQRSISNFLNDLTTSYYADTILDWAETKGIKFESGYGYGF
jgi:hypothetical protein